MYGERLETVADVQKVFVNFITQNVNENGVQVSFPSNLVLAVPEKNDGFSVKCVQISMCNIRPLSSLPVCENERMLCIFDEWPRLWRSTLRIARHLAAS